MSNELLALAFGENTLKSVQHKAAKWKVFAFGVALLALALSLPEELRLENFSSTFAASVAGFLLVLIACFSLSKVLGSHKTFKEFAGVTSVIGGVSAALVLILAGAANLVNAVLKNDAFSSLALSLIPFYSFVLFGWACETASDLKSSRGVVLGLSATGLFVLLHLVIAS